MVASPAHGMAINTGWMTGGRRRLTEEALATFRLRIVDGHVWIDPAPNIPGTFVAPVAVP